MLLCGNIIVVVVVEGTAQVGKGDGLFWGLYIIRKRIRCLMENSCLWSGPLRMTLLILDFLFNFVLKILMKHGTAALLNPDLLI